MSQRVVVIVGGCLLLGVGVLIGQTSNAVRNEEIRRDAHAGRHVRLEKLNHERRAFEIRRTEFLDAKPKRSQPSAESTGDVSPHPKRGRPAVDPFHSALPDAHSGKFQRAQGADESSTAGKASPPPAQLPDPNHAAPIRDNHKTADASVSGQKKNLRDIIREEYPQASEAFIDAYAKTLKGRSPHEVRNILEARRNGGSLISIGPSQSKPQTITRPQPLATLPGSEPGLPPVPHSNRPLLPAAPVASPLFRERSAAMQPALQPTVQSLRTAQSILLNNIANANTPGFKRTRISFTDLPYQRMPSSGAQVGQGVSVASTQKDWRDGPLRQTERQLDVAIVGKGFLQVSIGQEIAYTRYGRFSVNADGNLVVAVGDKQYLVEPSIDLPAGTTGIRIANDGTVSATLPQGRRVLVGQLQLSHFANPNGLSPLGHSLFAATKQSGAAHSGGPTTGVFGTLRQGFLESSNVDLQRELARLRSITRHLQAVQEASRLVNEPPSMLRSHEQSAERPGKVKTSSATQPTYRSLMDALKQKRRPTAPISEWHSTSSPAAESDSWWSRLINSPPTRQVEIKLGIVGNFGHRITKPHVSKTAKSRPAKMVQPGGRSRRVRRTASLPWPFRFGTVR